jgi:hypothetical protein
VLQDRNQLLALSTTSCEVSPGWCTGLLSRYGRSTTLAPISLVAHRPGWVAPPQTVITFEPFQNRTQNVLRRFESFVKPNSCLDTRHDYIIHTRLRWGCNDSTGRIIVAFFELSSVPAPT